MRAGCGLVWVWVIAGCGQVDADGDGYSAAAGDCDDLDAAVHPGAKEQCDGVDNDCDGTLDDPEDGEVFFLDADGDGFGDPDVEEWACEAPDGYVPFGSDCDDDNDNVHPLAEDGPNRDRNCDGDITEGTDAPGYGGSFFIDSASVSCSNGQVRFFVQANGWTDGGIVFSEETGNVEPHWSDEHDLRSYDFDPDGEWDLLDREILDATQLADPLDDVRRNESTLFACDTHYNLPGVMTYAFAVIDLNGALADCLMFGDDPEGLRNRSYDRVFEPSFPLEICTEGVSAG